MKKLITLVLCTGVVVLAIWSYNTNIHNTKITSSDEISQILQKNIEMKQLAKKYEMYAFRRKLIDSKIIVINKSKNKIPIYNIPLSENLQKYIYKLSKEKGVPHQLVLGVIKTESNFNSKANNINTNGSIDMGIMQINSCHEDLCKQLGVTDLYNPYQNIKVGVELLSNIYSKYPNIHKATMVYNMGLNGAKRNWKVGRGSTTYSRRVVKNINIIISSK